MKRADEAVEKVLGGLRGVKAAPGLEERMVRRVRDAARERGSAGWFGIWQWVAGGCVAVLLVGVGVNLRLREKRVFVARNIGSSGDADRRTGLERGGEIEEGVSQRLKPKRVMRGYGTAKAVPLSKAGFSGREEMLGSTWVHDAAKEARDGESREVAGLGGGFPAPPLPLTAQERLLLRAARSGEPVPVAVLEVSVLPTHDVEETAEFIEFFGQDRQIEQNKPGESE